MIIVELPISPVNALKLFLKALTILTVMLTVAPLQADIEKSRQLFRQASVALELNQVNKFRKLLAELEDYPLQPYLVNDALRRHIHRASVEKVSNFLDKYKDYPFAYHVRAKWLSSLAKRQNWEDYLTYFDNRDNTRLQCLAFQARLKLGRLEGINEQIKKIWLRGYSQPSECDIAFKYFLDTDENAGKAIWLRIEKAFQARRPNLARHLAKKLDEKDRVIVDLWYRAHRRPQQTLESLGKVQDEAINRTIIVHAIDRLARHDSLVARDTWLEIAPKFQFNQAQRDKIAQRIALSSAYQHQPEAKQLLIELPSELKNDQAYLWLARIQLRTQDWEGLVRTISEMPAHLQQENEWQYWLARSLEFQGFATRADDIMQNLSSKGNYYGFLAADRVERDYNLKQEDASISGIDEAAMLTENPYMLRARELFFLDRPVDAKREWFQALRKLDTAQIKQAATLASSWKWHDSAIKTVAKTSHRSDYSLRFPMPYKQQVMNHAESRQLDPSVIYGVMRRESLFDPMARSRVGALGLMQLMPETARHVANSLGLKKLRRADILKVDNNINLGTQYFRSVMNRFDNNVSLAAAAYNAGPLNVKKWLPRDEEVLPADLWVETVPFNETRNYVQAVLAYATVFDKTLGKDTLISSRMQVIRAQY